MPVPASIATKLRLRVLQFYVLLVLTTYFGVARSDLGQTLAGSDLFLHYTGYMVLMISARIALGQRQMLLFTGLLVYSIAIEIIQYFLPYRTFALLDILANLAGLSAGAVACLLYQRYSLRNSTASDRGSRTNEQG